VPGRKFKQLVDQLKLRSQLLEIAVSLCPELQHHFVELAVFGVDLLLEPIGPIPAGRRECPAWFPPLRIVKQR